MLNGLSFLNCDIGTEPAIVTEINDISVVSQAIQLSGVYDIVARVSEESKDDIAKLVKKILVIANIRSNLSMIVSGEEHDMKQMIEVA
jgi:hypothetical protein